MTQQNASSASSDALTPANHAVVSRVQACEVAYDDWGDFYAALQMLTIQAVKEMPAHSINISRQKNGYSVAIDGPVYSVTYNGVKSFT